MKVICVVLTTYFWAVISGQLSNSNSEQTVMNWPNVTDRTLVALNYAYDPQIPGFESTKITSGPLVLANKRTLYISNLQYQGSGDVLIFFAGIGSPYENQRQQVAEEHSFVNHTNLYVNLPENLSLDVIDFFGVSVDNSSELMNYVLFEKTNRNPIRDYKQETSEEMIYRFPKCCQHHEYLNTTAGGCVEAQEQINLNLNITIFESNVTGLDPDIRINASGYQLRPYIQGLKCKDDEYRLEVGDDLHGLIYNSSLIIQGTGILSHGEYCIELIEDNGAYRTNALYCYSKSVDSSDPNLYLPVLIISTICFAVSAVAYGIILKAKDIHKMCFIAFSSSMCLTFLSLIILQIQSSSVTCSIFGFVFLFSTVLSFLWLLILCLELLYLVWIPLEEKRNDQRLIWYIAASTGLSTLMFLISMFSGKLWVPDVPSSFIKSYGSDKCQFDTSFRRAFIIFVPMILSIVLSITSLVVVRTFVKKNEKDRKIKSHVDWMTNKNNYNFMSRTYVIIIVVASFWLLNLYSDQLGNAKTQLALDIIEASLGVVTIVGFVLNKYTLAEIKEKVWKKEKTITEESLRLNGIPTPETPVDSDDPFVQPLHRNYNLTSFGNSSLDKDVRVTECSDRGSAVFLSNQHRQQHF